MEEIQSKLWPFIEAKKLTKRTFADAVIFQNSGAEATEAAIKVARRYFYSMGQKKK